MANALGTLFGDIADAIREKTGGTDTMKPTEFPDAIRGIEAGTSADVRYVTFMSYDGSVEYGKKAVAVGDDCADPIARGLFTAPTRESTAQYSYTFAGWATTPGGGLDSAALKAVKEDRTVYANFAAVVRYYTISFYDGDTLLESKSVAYGSVPSIANPTKDGYSFERWEPSIVAVTGDADYYAQWIEKVTFAGSSWADIARVCEAGEAATYFTLGDTRQFTCNGYALTAEIVGLNLDTLSDGTGKAGISCIITGYYPVSYTYHSSAAEWGNSNLRAWCNGTIYSGIQDDLRAVIKQVVKYAQYDATCPRTDDYCWAPARTEVGGSSAYEGSCIVYTPFDQTKRALSVEWHLRSVNASLYHNYVDTSGAVKYETSIKARYLRFGFCV